MSVVVLGRKGAGSRFHCVTGYHGPGCIWLDIVFVANIFPINKCPVTRGYGVTGMRPWKNFASATERPITYTYLRLTSSVSMRAIHNRAAKYLAAAGAIFENMLQAQLSVKVTIRLYIHQAMCLLFYSIHFKKSLLFVLSFKRSSVRNRSKYDTCLHTHLWSKKPRT
jgi:hypothetical protein